MDNDTIQKLIARLAVGMILAGGVIELVGLYLNVFYISGIGGILIFGSLLVMKILLRTSSES
jgi:hypothetical protein